jgi:hypothetical protein
MTNTPGYARFLNGTGHSLDNEHPTYIASRIAQYLNSRNGAMSTEVSTRRGGPDYMSFAAPSFEVCRSACSVQAPCRAFTFTRRGAQGTCSLKSAAGSTASDSNATSGLKQ